MTPIVELFNFSRIVRKQLRNTLLTKPFVRYTRQSKNTPKVFRSFCSGRGQTKLRMNDQHSTTVSFLQRILLEIRSFSKGLELLLEDYRTYRNIEAAEASSTRNAWVRGIPRRQLEQRRQFLSDIQIALPTVALFMLPIIGYLAPLLATTFPRQLLSRQFHTAFQHRMYAAEEYNGRKIYFAKLTNLSIQRYQSYDKGATATTIKGLLFSSNTPILSDEAGPVISNMALFVQFMFRTMTTTLSRSTLKMNNALGCASSATNFDITALSNCALLDALSREHLHLLFMSTGYTKLPPYVANVLYNKYFFPSFIMKSVIRKVGSNIVHDDASLLKDLGDISHHLDFCSLSHLTDEEVLDACALRGLPIDTDKISTTTQMRKCLFNHLRQMAEVKSIFSQQEAMEKANNDLTNNMIRWPCNYNDPVHDVLILLPLQMVSLRYGLQQEGMLAGC